MVSTISINPIVTSNAAGSFGVTWDGYMQGTAMDQPAIRYSLAGGYLASTETLPMWGGVAISENIPGATSTPNQALGSQIIRATNMVAQTAASVTGFSVFDQNPAMINTPESPVPLAASGMQVNFYRLGSNARIAVQCSPNLVNFEGLVISSKVTWDLVDQILEPYVSTTLASLISYTSGTGVVSLTTAAAHGLNPGDYVYISGVTGTGANIGLINGEQLCVTGTTGTTLNIIVATGQTITTITGGAVGLASGALANLTVLDVSIGNSMTVNYAAGTGYATWNRAGNCALIEI